MKPVILVLLSCIVLLMWMKLQCPTLPVGMKGAIENHLANIGTEINPAASHNAVLWKGTTVLTNWEQCTGWRMLALLHLAHTPVPDRAVWRSQTKDSPLKTLHLFFLSLELHDSFWWTKILQKYFIFFRRNVCFKGIKWHVLPVTDDKSSGHNQDLARSGQTVSFWWLTLANLTLITV